MKRHREKKGLPWACSRSLCPLDGHVTFPLLCSFQGPSSAGEGDEEELARKFVVLMDTAERSEGDAGDSVGGEVLADVSLNAGDLMHGGDPFFRL